MPENIPSPNRRIEVAASVRTVFVASSPYRRAGRSTMCGELCPHVQVIADTPTFAMTDFWRHEQVPVDNAGPAAVRSAGRCDFPAGAGSGSALSSSTGRPLGRRWGCGSRMFTARPRSTTQSC